MLVASNNIGARAADSRRVTRHPREKVEIVEHVIAWMAETGLSLSHAAEIIHVSKANLSRWMKDLPALKEKSKSPSGPRTSHAGRTSQLAPVHEELLHFVEEYRFMGFAISKKMLIFQASRLSEEESLFRRNTYAWNRKSLEYFPLPNVAEANSLAGGVGVVGNESERDGMSGEV